MWRVGKAKLLQLAAVLAEEEACPVLIGRGREDKAAAKHNTVLYLTNKSGLEGRGNLTRA